MAVSVNFKHTIKYHSVLIEGGQAKFFDEDGTWLFTWIPTYDKEGLLLEAPGEIELEGR